ncbi:MAG: protein kinase [Gemmatimonadota bacterium]|nr:MAG: protein kinase [Gemmatimonadota bacterium]
MDDFAARLTTALGDRYAIERELGSGGMATVYLAEDLKHHRKVAVKVLRPDLAATLGPERFLREIEIAARLQHPHILPLLDSGDADGFLYYVMPYVEGQSLRDKLAKEGELPVGEAVRIIRDVVDALTAAHALGVVHRDIKPENVLLSGRHALVSDFGVAKAVSEATGREKLTTAGVALGTPAYMAPEQAAADPHLDHRVDIYAVGAMAYELLTGRPVFMGTTPQQVLSAHVTEAPQPVTRHRGTVPPALESVVMRCLEKKPADRFQDVWELLPLLEALTTPSGGVTPTGLVPVDRAAKRRWMMIGGAAGVAVVIALIVLVAALANGSGIALDQRRVAVLPFENQTGEDSLDVHGVVAASWITDVLQQANVMSVVPSLVVQQELGALEGGNPVREVAELTGAGIVVTGSYSRVGDSLRFRAGIIDAAGMELVHAVPPASGLPGSPEAAFAELSGRVAGALAIMGDTVFAAELEHSLQLPSFAAYREYVAGLDLFTRGRYDDAIQYFVRANELDASFFQVLLWAAVAHSNRGRWAEADSLAQMLEPYRGRASNWEQQMLDWFRATLRGDNREALRIVRAVDDNYLVGLYATRVNRPQEAIAALEKMDPTRGRMKQWVPYWNVLTAARHMLGDHRRELRDAQRGRELYPDRRAAFRYEARALAALGRVDEAETLFDELLRLPPDPSWGHAYEAAMAGLEFRAHGYPEAAREALQLALDRLRAHSPDEALRRSHQYNVGWTLYWSERWEEAREIFLQLVAEDSTSVDYLGSLGVVHARLGDAVEASRISDELEALDQPYLRGVNTVWRAEIAAILGNSDGAVDVLRRAFSEGYGYGIGLHRDIDFEALHDYPPFQELMRPKG